MQNGSTQFTVSKHVFVAMCMLVVPISGLGVDIYLPSLPAITHYFHVEKALVQLTISAYVLGLGLMQILAGPISDTYGRRYPFLVSLAIYIAATLLVPVSQNIYHLLVLRFIQGMAAAAAIVPIRAITSDVFEGREQTKVVSYMTIAWSIGPIIAPAIGGYLQHYYGWQSNFYFLAIYSGLAFVFGLFLLPETSQYRHPLHLGKIASRFYGILTNTQFQVSVAMNGLLYSMILLFSVVGPFLIQVDLKYSAINFGHMALLLGAAWFGGTLSHRFTIDKSNELKEVVSLSVMLLVAIGMLLAALWWPINIYMIIPPIFLILWFGGIIFPRNFATVFAVFPTVSGSANALFGGILFSLSSVTAAFAVYLKSTTVVPLACGYIAIIVLCWLLHFCRKANDQ